METDPLEGSSYDLGVNVKTEIKEEDDEDHYNTMYVTVRCNCFKKIHKRIVLVYSPNWIGLSGRVF